MNIDFNRLSADFRGLDPKDIGTWPTFPKIVTLVAIFSSILTAGWFVLGADLVSKIESEKVQLENSKKEYLEKKKQAVNLDSYKNQLVEIDKSFGQLLRQLPSKSEVDNLLIEV
ncbi:MAG TPA: type 4a pilus biogenesis protein PilO, partial [Ignavibacteriaceae bacterium]